MGPTNVALVKLSRADQALREAQGRLDAAEKNVRVQDRRTNDLAERLRLAQAKLKEEQANAARLDLELKAHDEHIEKLRTQQQQAKNNKEYQAFLVEINTGKVDRAKVEDEAVKAMETVEKGTEEAQALTTQHATERARLAEMRTQIVDTVNRLKAEVAALQPAREEAGAALPARVREAFERLAEHHDGEALSAIAKPDRRREEYLCTACNMDLVTDIYNKLHSRDEIVFCPSCRRILYIPEDLPPETAINTRGRAGVSIGAKTESGKPLPPPRIEPRAKGRTGDLLTAAQGESVRGAIDAGQIPVELEVYVDGRFAGQYKGKSAEHLERVIKFRMEEAGTQGMIEVREKTADVVEASTAPEAPAAAQTPAPAEAQ